MHRHLQFVRGVYLQNPAWPKIEAEMNRSAELLGLPVADCRTARRDLVRRLDFYASRAAEFAEHPESEAVMREELRKAQTLLGLSDQDCRMLEKAKSLTLGAEPPRLPLQLPPPEPKAPPPPPAPPPFSPLFGLTGGAAGAEGAARIFGEGECVLLEIAGRRIMTGGLQLRDRLLWRWVESAELTTREIAQGWDEFETLEEAIRKLGDLATNAMHAGLRRVVSVAEAEGVRLPPNAFVPVLQRSSATFAQIRDAMIDAFEEIEDEEGFKDRNRTMRRQLRTRVVGMGSNFTEMALNASIAGTVNIASNLTHGLFNVAAKGVSSSRAEQRRQDIKATMGEHLKKAAHQHLFLLVDEARSLCAPHFPCDGLEGLRHRQALASAILREAQAENADRFEVAARSLSLCQLGNAAAAILLLEAILKSELWRENLDLWSGVFDSTRTDEKTGGLSFKDGAARGALLAGLEARLVEEDAQALEAFLVKTRGLAQGWGADDERRALQEVVSRRLEAALQRAVPMEALLARLDFANAALKGGDSLSLAGVQADALTQYLMDRALRHLPDAPTEATLKRLGAGHAAAAWVFARQAEEALLGRLLQKPDFSEAGTYAGFRRILAALDPASRAHAEQTRAQRKAESEAWIRARALEPAYKVGTVVGCAQAARLLLNGGAEAFLKALTQEAMSARLASETVRCDPAWIAKIAELWSPEAKSLWIKTAARRVAQDVVEGGAFGREAYEAKRALLLKADEGAAEDAEAFDREAYLCARLKLARSPEREEHPEEALLRVARFLRVEDPLTRPGLAEAFMLATQKAVLGLPGLSAEVVKLDDLALQALLDRIAEGGLELAPCAVVAFFASQKKSHVGFVVTPAGLALESGAWISFAEVTRGEAVQGWLQAYVKLSVGEAALELNHLDNADLGRCVAALVETQRALIAAMPEGDLVGDAVKTQGEALALLQGFWARKRPYVLALRGGKPLSDGLHRTLLRMDLKSWATSEDSQAQSGGMRRI